MVALQRKPAARLHYDAFRAESLRGASITAVAYGLSRAFNIAEKST
jgi:hypothetical protein